MGKSLVTGRNPETVEKHPMAKSRARVVTARINPAMVKTNRVAKVRAMPR